MTLTLLEITLTLLNGFPINFQKSHLQLHFCSISTLFLSVPLYPEDVFRTD